ncbi:lysylphosphatidylglycerol synthase transmembrane domain-containing protein [Desulforhopalus sp. 52FAK]
MSNRIRNALSIFFLTLFTTWLIYYIRNNIHEFEIIFNLSWLPTIILTFLIFGESIFSGLFTKVVMEHFAIRLKWREWYGLSVITRFWNIILPFRGGAGVRALYLKRVYKFPFTKFFATLLSLYFLIFIINSAIGTACVILLYLLNNILIYQLLIFFIIIFLLICAFIFLPIKIPESRFTLLNKINQATTAWHGINKDFDAMKQLIGITIINSVVGLYLVYYSYYAFGVQLSLFQSLLISTLFNFTAMINITPGSIGVVESIMVITAQIFGISPTESLLAAGLIRVIHLILMIILGIFFNYKLGLNLRGKKNII